MRRAYIVSEGESLIRNACLSTTPVILAAFWVLGFS